MLLHGRRLFPRALTRRTMSTLKTTPAPDAYLLFPTSTHPQLAPDKLWATARPKNKTGEAKIFYNQIHGQPDVLTGLVSLGEGFDAKPENGRREAVRRAVGSGVKQLRDAGATAVAIDDSVDPHAAGVYI